MEIAHFLAISAAFSWTLASLFGHRMVRSFGALHFNRLRMLASAFLLCLMLVLTGGSFHMPAEFWVPVILSTVIGVVLGDYFLFTTMRRMGPRRTGILFALNAPLAAWLSWLLLNEPLSSFKISALIMGFIGVCLAIIFGKRRDLLHVWEDITPPLWIGVVTGFLAAMGQAGGVLLLQPVMAQGANPILVGLMRVCVAALFFWASWPFDKNRKYQRMAPDHIGWLFIFGNAFFGLSFGMFLLLKALETGAVADVTLLSAMGPVLILPFVWFQTKKCPAWGAWLGAVCVIASSALLAYG